VHRRSGVQRQEHRPRCNGRRKHRECGAGDAQQVLGATGTDGVAIAPAGGPDRSGSETGDGRRGPLRLFGNRPRNRGAGSAIRPGIVVGGDESNHQGSGDDVAVHLSRGQPDRHVQTTIRVLPGAFADQPSGDANVAGEPWPPRRRPILRHPVQEGIIVVMKKM